MASNTAKLFQNVEELLEAEESSIIGTGEIPKWMNGNYIIVGPGKWDLGEVTMNHFLDGYAIMSKFEITNRKVLFTKRYLESEAYLKATMAQRPLITEFGTKAHCSPHSKGIICRILSTFTPPEMSDNAGLAFFQLSPKDLFVTSNTTYFRKVDPETLETFSKKYDYGKCFGYLGAGVHPLRDSFGYTYNIGFSVLTGPKYVVTRIPPPTDSSDAMISKSTTLCSIPCRWNTGIGFFHSFGLTSNFIIFIEVPYVISLTKAAKSVIRGDSYKDWLEWKPQEPTKFILVEKETGKIRKLDYLAPPLFFLHVVNSYEEDNQIILDLNAYDSPAVIESLSIKVLRNTCESPQKIKDPPSIQRFILPLIKSVNDVTEGVDLVTNHHNLEETSPSAIRKGSQIHLTPKILSDPGIELPTINPNFQGRRHSYVYAPGTICESNFRNSLCKISTETREVNFWRGRESEFPGEALLITPTRNAYDPNEAKVDEDDGILISACSSISEDYQDFLLFLNPKTMEEIGRASFNSRIPQAMHGIFLSKAA